MFELQVKIKNKWKTLFRNPDKEYLDIVYHKQYARFDKYRILKIK